MTITGGAGNDSIVSKGKNATITGGKGKDTLAGGSGTDIFIYSEGDGNDVITNFDEMDKISLKSGAGEISTNGNDTITDYSPNIDTVIILSAVNVGNPVSNSSGDVTFKIGGNGQITFKDCANKHIELVDKGGNRLMKYNPNKKKNFFIVPCPFPRNLI